MIIEITGGQVVVDDEDYPLVQGIRWHVNDAGYAVWRGFKDGKKQTIRMHRLVNKTPYGMETDHINHNRLDNRKSNLRTCNRSENMRNKQDQGKGYWYQKQNDSWVVEINSRHRGIFDTEAEAKQWVALVRAGLADKKPKIVRSYCKYGHSLRNAYHYAWGILCRECQSIRSKAYYRRKTA